LASSSTTEADAVAAPKTRWRLDLEYDGADFAGWQLQPGERTIQGVLEAALEVICGHPVRVGAAGRTDAGVHALQQVACFQTSTPRMPREMVGGLNANLPEDVVVVTARPVPDAFDPRRSPHVKCYRYRWLVSDGRRPLRRRAVWQVRCALDAERMDAAVQALIGEHDFSSFRASGCTAKHPRRIVEAARVFAREDEVLLELEGRAFLRYMVRNIAGTLYDVGRGRCGVDHLATVLEARDRGRAGRTAPPQGLVLAWIRYLDGELGDEHQHER